MPIGPQCELDKLENEEQIEAFYEEIREELRARKKTPAKGKGRDQKTLGETQAPNVSGNESGGNTIPATSSGL